MSKTIRKYGYFLLCGFVVLLTTGFVQGTIQQSRDPSINSLYETILFCILAYGTVALSVWILFKIFKKMAVDGLISLKTTKARIMRKESARTLWPAEEILTVGELKEVLATISNDDSHLASHFGNKEKPVSMVKRVEIDTTFSDSKGTWCYILDLLEM